MPTTKKKEPLPGPSRLVNDWQFVINMNCYEDIQSVDEHCSFTHKLSSCEIKAMDLNPWPVQYHGSTLVQTGLSSQCNSMQVNAEITVIFFKQQTCVERELDKTYQKRKLYSNEPPSTWMLGTLWRWEEHLHEQCSHCICWLCIWVFAVDIMCETWSFQYACCLQLPSFLDWTWLP